MKKLLIIFFALIGLTAKSQQYQMIDLLNGRFGVVYFDNNFLDYNIFIYTDTQEVEIRTNVFKLSLDTCDWNGTKFVAQDIENALSNPSAPSNHTISTDTTFQPNPLAASHIAINTMLVGSQGDNENITVSISDTQNGSFTVVSDDVLVISVQGVQDRNSITIPVPKGYWVKIQNNGSNATATYSRWDY